LHQLLLPTLLAGATPASNCPGDMVHIRGKHHEQVQRLCTDRRRGKCYAFVPNLALLEPRVTAIDVCMDRYEWPNKKGTKPAVMDRFIDAEAKCKSIGKRLCSEFEWELACEGPHHLPWPYGHRQQPGWCHNDRRYRPHNEAKLSSNDPRVRARETARLWQGLPAGSKPKCKSPFGVFDQIGNVEEWVTTSRPEWPHRSSLKGGFWAKAWSFCRGTNERHNPRFRFYEIGFRCCKDPQKKPARRTQRAADSLRALDSASMWSRRWLNPRPTRRTLIF